MAVTVAVRRDDEIEKYEGVDKAIFKEGAVQLHYPSEDADEIDGELFGATDGRFRVFVNPPEENAQVESFGEATYAMRMPDDAVKVIHHSESHPETEQSQYIHGEIINIQSYDD